MAAKVKRGYSRAFTPHGNTGKNYLLDSVPAGLWSAVKAQAKREGLSVRALILTRLSEYIELTTAARAANAAPVETAPAPVAVRRRYTATNHTRTGVALHRPDCADIARMETAGTLGGRWDLILPGIDLAAELVADLNDSFGEEAWTVNDVRVMPCTADAPAVDTAATS